MTLDELNAQIKKIKSGFIPSAITTVGDVGMVIRGVRTKRKEVDIEGRTAQEIMLRSNQNKRTGNTLIISGSIISGIGAIMNSFFIAKLERTKEEKEKLSVEFKIVNPYSFNFI